MRYEFNLAEKIHRYTHAKAREMKTLIWEAGRINLTTELACEMVYQACETCASSGRQVEQRKISVSHVNKAFQEDMQTDFLYV